MYDALEIEAMLIRREAAARMHGELSGIELLTHVVAPGAKLREISRALAEERGPSSFAVQLARARRWVPPRKPAPLVQRRRPRPTHRERIGVSLDEILAAA